MIGEKKKMNKLIIASHGALAEGFLDSARFIMGKIENVECIKAYVDPKIDYEKLIEDKVSSFDYLQGNLIVATDLVGGSVNAEFLKYLGKYPFYLIAGVNLVTVISLVSILENEIDKDVINKIVENAKDTVIFCDEIKKAQNDDF